LNNLWSRIRKLTRTPYLSAILIAIVYTALTIYITLLMHDSYHTYAFDLGAFTQTLKYTLQGKLLWHPSIGLSELSHHFSPALLFLVPLYWLFPYAQMLLVVQGITLGCSGYLVYLLAREHNYSQRTSLIIEILFFVNPLVWGVALFDFHPVVFAIPAILAMFMGMKRKKWLLFGVGLFFALISREDAIVAIGVFGVVQLIYTYFKTKRIDRISIVLIASATVAAGLALAVSAAASTGQPPVILSYFTNRYTYVEQSLWQAILSALGTVFSSGSFFLICAYLVPLGLLPLLSLQWSAPALVIMLTGMLSDRAQQHEELNQYPAVAIPFLFLAFIIALPRLKEDPLVQCSLKYTAGRIKGYSIALLVVASLIIITMGRIQLVQLPSEHDKVIDQVLAAIPDGATVTASNDIFPHICSRTDTYLPEFLDTGTGIIDGDWGYPDRDTEYVVVDSMHMQLSTGGYWEIAIMRQIAEKYDLILNIDGTRLYRLRETQ
jgi:uncharacterized membrane protein